MARRMSSMLISWEQLNDENLNFVKSKNFVNQSVKYGSSLTASTQLKNKKKNTKENDS
jgi:hypothetical protein